MGRALAKKKRLDTDQGNRDRGARSDVKQNIASVAAHAWTEPLADQSQRQPAPRNRQNEAGPPHRISFGQPRRRDADGAESNGGNEGHAQRTSVGEQPSFMHGIYCDGAAAIKSENATTPAVGRQFTKVDAKPSLHALRKAG